MSGGPCKCHPRQHVRVEFNPGNGRFGRYCWACHWWPVAPTYRVKEAVPRG